AVEIGPGRREGGGKVPGLEWARSFVSIRRCANEARAARSLPRSRTEASMKPFRIPRWSFTNCCGHYWSRKPAPGPAEGDTRREFFRTAAAGAVGLAAMATLPAGARAQVRVFPPPPPSVSPIDGLIDFPNHNAPDV